MSSDDRKYKSLFDNIMEQMYCIMINAKKGSTEKRVVKSILSKTMKKTLYRATVQNSDVGISQLVGLDRKSVV